jgi:tripeptide aminopeptidase
MGMVNEQRLADLFMKIVTIDSVSRQEHDMSLEIQKMARELGATCEVDQSGRNTGSNTGNLVLKWKGTQAGPPLLLSGHMDTVEPGRGIKPKLQDGVFTSSGNTILGADDKSAIAIIFEAIRVLQENQLAYCPLEVVFTTCEEIGLQGAKHFDFSLISATQGYVLDTSDTGIIVNRAPSANRLEFKIIGKDAHAGVVPEEGVNAIYYASKAISNLALGRIDHETTCNIGVITGGVATNIVPSTVIVQGEVRSHSEEKLKKVTDDILQSFQEAVSQNRETNSEFPTLEYSIENDFPLTNIPSDHPVITIAQQAAVNKGRVLSLKSTGGGADANIFFKNGIMAGVIGTGMTDMHSVRESIKLEDMVQTAELLLEIIRLHSEH